MILGAFSPKEIRKKLLIRWERGNFYKKEDQLFPLAESTGHLSSKDIAGNFDGVRQWINLYRDDSSVTPYLQWETVTNRFFGKNELPVKLIFENLGELADFLHKRKELNRMRALLQALHGEDSRLEAWGESHPFVLFKAEKDFERLLKLWRWMVKHPRPGIYLRQIDLAGIDTKFTEQYKKVLYTWLDLTLPEEMIDRKFNGTSRFERRFGFKGKPELIRFRFLDSALEWRGCSDISLPADQFCQLFKADETIPVERVFIVENDICGLAFPPVENAMVIFGRGYHFENWKEAWWLKEREVYYWGDLDTHGFAILSQFREIFPQTKSFLMDRKTLLENEISWVREPKPTSSELRHLSKEEQELYDDLRFNRIKQNLRLEQEFIPFGHILTALEN